MQGCGHTLSKEDILWKEAGFDVTVSQEWRSRGYSLRDAKRWKNYNLTVFDALDWSEFNFSPKVAQAWKEINLSPEEAAKWRLIKVNAEEYLFWRNLGIGYYDVQLWQKTGLSRTAITIMRQLGFSADQAIIFTFRSFSDYPGTYAKYANTIYRYLRMCDNARKAHYHYQTTLLSQCESFERNAKKHMVYGYLLDMQKNKDKEMLEQYLLGLRKLKSETTKMLDAIYRESDESIEVSDTAGFKKLFPITTEQPRLHEMVFIDENNLSALQHSERYLNYDNFDYWQEKADNIAEALEVAKEKERLRKERVKREKIERRKRIEELAELRRQNTIIAKRRRICGPDIANVRYALRHINLRGKVEFTVSEVGSNLFGYGVRNEKDGELYYIRNPKPDYKVGDFVNYIVDYSGRTLNFLIIKNKGILRKDSDTRLLQAIYVDECSI